MKMDQILEIYFSILCIHNDLCIYIHSELEYNSNLLNLMQVASDYGLTFNSMIFSVECIKPDLDKIQGITEMSPSDVQQLQSPLGMINFV